MGTTTELLTTFIQSTTPPPGTPGDGISEATAIGLLVTLLVAIGGCIGVGLWLCHKDGTLDCGNADGGSGAITNQRRDGPLLVPATVVRTEEHAAAGQQTPGVKSAMHTDARPQTDAQQDDTADEGVELRTRQAAGA